MTTDSSVDQDGNPSGSDSSTKQSNSDADKDFIPKSQYDDLIDRFSRLEKGNNWAQSRVKELEKELQAKSSSSSDNDADSSKKDRLANAEKRIEELEAVKTDLEGKVRVFTVKNKIFDELGDILRPEAKEAFWALEGHKFDVNEEGKVCIDDNPYVDIKKDYGEHLKQNHSYFVQNPRAAGGDVPGKEKSQGGGKSIRVEELDKMPSHERTGLMARDKDLRDAYIKYKRGT